MRIEELKTPCYVIDEKQLKKSFHSPESGKGYRMQNPSCTESLFLLLRISADRSVSQRNNGKRTFEARLGKEEMGKENHVFAPAYKEEDVKELVKICDHMVFNSFSQLEKYKTLCKETSVGIRINPECSTQGDHAIYDPCAKAHASV